MNDAQDTAHEPTQVVPRRGRGSMAGQLILVEDWDSPDTNEQPTSAFGLSS